MHVCDPYLLTYACLLSLYLLTYACLSVLILAACFVAFLNACLDNAHLYFRVLSIAVNGFVNVIRLNIFAKIKTHVTCLIFHSPHSEKKNNLVSYHFDKAEKAFISKVYLPKPRKSSTKLS